MHRQSVRCFILPRKSAVRVAAGSCVTAKTERAEVTAIKIKAPTKGQQCKDKTS